MINIYLWLVIWRAVISTIVSRGLLIFFPSWRSYYNTDVVGLESAISGRCVGGGGRMETFPDLSVRIHALAG